MANKISDHPFYPFLISVIAVIPWLGVLFGPALTYKYFVGKNGPALTVMADMDSPTAETKPALTPEAPTADKPADTGESDSQIAKPEEVEQTPEKTVGTKEPADAASRGDQAAQTKSEAAEAETVQARQAAEAQTGTDSLPPPSDPPGRSADESARIEQAVAALKQAVAELDYQQAMYHPLHFAPRIQKASDEECLVCHGEILAHKPRAVAPVGISADATLAWYQTLDTYKGRQETFHHRHLESPFAKQVMNLPCNFCHRGNDPREEAPNSNADNQNDKSHTLRKSVNTSNTCLRCHGAMPDPVNIMGLDGPWETVRADFEDEDTPNGCLSCHAEAFRTVRHQVTYLKAAGIEKAAVKSSDVCYGCHGGRRWYRIAYPYARHPWPGMEEEMPEWAKARPVQSDPEHRLKEDAN